MREWLGLAARVVVGGVWIVAGALKLPDPARSVASVRAYQLLPAEVVPAVGQLLPVLEVVVGLALVLGVLTRPAAVVSVLLLVAFVVGIASVWARGIQIDCGCFGGGGTVAGGSSRYPVDITRDAALLLASTFLVRWPRTRWSVDDLLLGRGPAGDPAR